MKKTIAFILAAMLNFICLAQQSAPIISFEKDIYNFGSVNDTIGRIDCKYTFTNTGDKPLIVTDVIPACNCIKPTWKKDSILPGNTGYIEIIADLKNQGGENFNKVITVKSNAKNNTVILTLKGFVIAHDKTANELYPYAIGNLRFQKKIIDFGTIRNTGQKTDTVKFFNSSDKKIRIKIKDSPAYIKYAIMPKKIKPGQKGFIILTYIASLKNDWDFLIDPIYILQNNQATEKNKFIIAANIIEDFSNLTSEQIANAPVIEFKEITYNAGNIGVDSAVEHEFIFQNNGKSDLILRKVKATCGCTIAEPKDKIIAPGMTSSIKAYFKANNNETIQNKTITVISNDPKNYKIELTLKANITN